MRRLWLAFALACVVFGGGRALADVSIFSHAITSKASITGGTVTLGPLTTSAVTGDLLVAFISTFNSVSAGPCVTVTPPPGWTTAGTPTCTNSRNENYVMTATAAGNDTPTFTGTFASGTVYASVIAYDVQGANTTTPIDQISAYQSVTPSTAMLMPATANTLVNGDMLFSQYMSGQTNAQSTGYTCTAPCSGTWTLVHQSGSSAAPNLGVVSQPQAIAGAFNPASITVGTAPTQVQGDSVAIAAAVVTSNPFYLLPELHAGKSLTAAVLSPLPTPIPGGTPLPGDSMAWWNGQSGLPDNKAITAGDAAKYLGFCNGIGVTTGGAEITAACPHSYVYMDMHAVYVSASGVTVNLPFHINETSIGGRTCPAAATSSTAFWKQSPPAFNFTDATVANNWGLYPTGQTVGSNHLGVSTDASDYVIFLNVTAPGLLSYINSVFGNCQIIGGANNTRSPADSYEGFFEDNWYNNGKYIWGVSFYAGLDAQKSWGISNGSPYTSLSNCNGGIGSPSTFFNGSLCTMTTQYTTNNAVQGTYGSSTAATDTAMANAFAGIHHFDGTQFKFIYNGYDAPNPTIQGGPGVVNGGGGTMENFLLLSSCGAGTTMPTGVAPDYRLGCTANDGLISEIIDNCAAVASDFPTTRAVLLTNFPNSSNGAGLGATLGSAAHQWAQRLAAAPSFLCAHDSIPGLFVSWAELERSTLVDPNQTETWAWEFARPFTRDQAYPARPTGAGGAFPCGENLTSHFGTGCQITTGGAWDPVLCATGTPPDCVARVEWEHFFYQPTPDLTSWPGTQNYISGNTVTDLGRFGMIWNRTSAPITLSSTNLAAWLGHYSSYARVLVMCTPLTGGGGYVNTTGSGSVYNVANGQAAVCGGISSGHDAQNGGTLDHSVLLSQILNETLPVNDVLYVSAN